MNEKREPACITTVNAGNTVMIVTAFFSEAAQETAADKMARVLDLEAVCREQKNIGMSMN